MYFIKCYHAATEPVSRATILILMYGIAMNAIDEQELMDYAANGVISQFKIRETDEDRFCLVVTVSWKEGTAS